MQRLEKILAQKAAPKSARMAKLLPFWQGYPKPAFSEKVQSPKNSHRLKGLKALWRKWHYPPISMLFKLQRLEKILGQKAAPKVPE